jgi:predicted phage-related endonuclease
MLTREQLRARRAFIGASDIPAIAGLSRFKGPHHVYMQKVPEPCPTCKGKGGEHLAADGSRNPTMVDAPTWHPCGACEGSGELDVVDDQSVPAEIGDLAEPLIATLYERRTGRKLRKCTQSIVHPSEPWASATPDFEVVDGGPDVEDVEVKMVGRYMVDEWGDGEEDVPADYYAQVTWQMWVRNKKRTHVAAVLGGTEFRMYEIALNHELLADLVGIGRDFHARHIVARVPPPIDGTDSARDFLHRRFPEHRLGMAPAPLEALGIVTELRALKENLKLGELRKQDLENQIKAMICEFEGIEAAAWGSATWKTTASNGVAWKDAYAAARERLRALISGMVEQSIIESKVLDPGVDLLRMIDDAFGFEERAHIRPGSRRLHLSEKTSADKGKRKKKGATT